MNETTVTVVGNVASDVRHVTTARGVSLASFRLASTPRRFDRNLGWVDGTTSFYSVTCWRHLAEHVRSSVRMGEPVVVTGRLSVREWERDDRRGVTVEVDATSVGHDLSRGTSTFARPVRESSSPHDDRAAAEELADDFSFDVVGRASGRDDAPTSEADDVETGDPGSRRGAPAADADDVTGVAAA